MSAARKDKPFMAPPATVASALPWLADAQKLAAASAPGWMTALRATGAEAFAATGIPTPALEGWQFTKLRSLETGGFRYDTKAVAATGLPAPLLKDSYRLVLVNGKYAASESFLPAQARISALDEAAHVEEDLVTVGQLGDRPMMALNAAYAADGFVLEVPAGAELDKPLEVLFWQTGDQVASYPRVLYRLGENSGAMILERHSGKGVYFANNYIAVSLQRDARLKLYRFVEEDAKASHFSHMCVRQAKGSSFEGFSGAFNGGLVRQEINLELLEEAISASISGIYTLKDSQVHDFTILAEHFEPGGTSAQHFKGVIDAQACAVFQGKIHVHRSAQKTDGYQSHHALLLSKDSEASAKPELEIYADDVKCSHGATSGFLDQNALFYLQSRGIPAAQAQSLLIHSFLASVVEQVSDEAIRALYLQKAAAWLEARPS